MIRSIIQLNVERGRELEFEGQFRQRGVLERATWDSAEDYQVWMTSPVRVALSATPPQLSQPAAPADLYEIVERFE